MERWSINEIKEVKKYFNTNITEMTLYQRIQKLNGSRTYEGMMRKIRYFKEDGWERNKANILKKLRVGYLDIEADNLNANFGTMLSWFIKTEGKNEYRYSVVTKKELFDMKFDKRVVEELLEAMTHYDVLYTHYGSDRRFDIPFIRTKALMFNLEDKLPKYMETFIMDTYPIARNKLKLHSNRLDVIAETLGIKLQKTRLSPEKWRFAKYGDKKALDYILDHNKKDVQILEQVYQKLKFIDRPIYRSI